MLNIIISHNLLFARLYRLIYGYGRSTKLLNSENDIFEKQYLRYGAEDKILFEYSAGNENLNNNKHSPFCNQLSYH